MKAKYTYINKQVNLELKTQNGKEIEDNGKQIEEIKNYRKQKESTT